MKVNVQGVKIEPRKMPFFLTVRLIDALETHGELDRVFETDMKFIAEWLEDCGLIQNIKIDEAKGLIAIYINDINELFKSDEESKEQTQKYIKSIGSIAKYYHCSPVDLFRSTNEEVAYLIKSIETKDGGKNDVIRRKAGNDWFAIRENDGQVRGKLFHKYWMVYEDGKVYSRKVHNKICNEWHEVTYHLNSKDYERVEIDQQYYFVHRLVYELFVGEIPNDLTVDHINRNHHDNRVENLRLATFGEQVENRDWSRIKKGVRQISTGKEFESVEEAKRVTGKYIDMSREYIRKDWEYIDKVYEQFYDVGRLYKKYISTSERTRLFNLCTVEFTKGLRFDGKTEKTDGKYNILVEDTYGKYGVLRHEFHHVFLDYLGIEQKEIWF